MKKCKKPDSRIPNDIVGAENLTYEEYQKICENKSSEKREAFERCFYSIPLNFKGRIQRKNNKHVCFERVFISGMYDDGRMYDDKEDHVWMDIDGFEKYDVGQALSFGAEVYRYIKTGSGKAIDFGLRNPQDIELISDYDLPTDKELFEQEMKMIKCEVCLFNEQCTYTYCLKR